MAISLIDESKLKFVADDDNRSAINLKNWRVCRAVLPNGKVSNHLVGDWENKHIVSSGMSLFVAGNSGFWALTRGIYYNLIGPPRYSFPAFCTWIKWCEINKVVKEMDVTREYTNR